ncbi:hypothetical protein [Streptomyces sp. NRRL S-1868]|uniref:hypothetical protein n=1 Tax=Streptomyces sp. NRRL S-1868 TaxID=1463892 RepID=UPI0004C9A5CD|nr:hypothetical protein [Streptomyces sp. NRRL S-1868]
MDDHRQRLDPDSPGRTPGHPVAVHGTVQRIHHDRAGRPFVSLADHTDLDGREFEVVLRSMHPTLIEPLTVGTHVLAVGDWAIFPGGRVPQLRLFAEAAWQIAYWHTDQESGTATRPASPPAVTARQRTTERPARPAQRTSRSTKTGRRPTTPPRRPAPAPPPLQAPAPRAEARDSPPPPAAPPDPERKTPTTESDESPADASAKQPALPPRPPHPPKPTSPPPLPASRRRKGLPAWLGRRKHRRR